MARPVCLNHPKRRPQKPWTPELDRRSVVIDAGQASLLAGFLDHLADERHFVLAKWAGAGGCDLVPVHERPEAVLAAFFKLDLDRIEREKLALINYVRALDAWHTDQRERVARAVRHYERAQEKVKTR